VLFVGGLGVLETVLYAGVTEAGVGDRRFCAIVSLALVLVLTARNQRVRTLDGEERRDCCSVRRSERGSLGRVGLRPSPGRDDLVFPDRTRGVVYIVLRIDIANLREARGVETLRVEGEDEVVPPPVSVMVFFVRASLRVVVGVNPEAGTADGTGEQRCKADAEVGLAKQSVIRNGRKRPRGSVALHLRWVEDSNVGVVSVNRSLRKRRVAGHEVPDGYGDGVGSTSIPHGSEEVAEDGRGVAMDIFCDDVVKVVRVRLKCLHLELFSARAGNVLEKGDLGRGEDRHFWGHIECP